MTDVTAHLKPFTIDIPDATLADLRDRRARMRWPEDFGNDAWQYDRSIRVLAGTRESVFTRSASRISRVACGTIAAGHLA